jgi:ankyrin repeat protein
MEHLEGKTDAELAHLAQLVQEEQTRRCREQVRKAVAGTIKNFQKVAQQRKGYYERRIPDSTLHKYVYAAGAEAYSDDATATLAAVDQELAAGADINATDDERRTALWLAASRGHVDCLRALLERGADVKKPATHKRTPVWAATVGNHAAALRVLVNNGADVANDPSGPLLVACKLLHTSAVRELIRGGARDETGEALCLAVEKGLDAELVALLCDSGGSPLREIDGEQPLSIAVKEGYEDICEVLLSKGADVYGHSYEDEDLSPMMWALEPGYGRPMKNHDWRPKKSIAKLLVARGCDVNKLQGPGAEYRDESHAWGSRLVVWAATRDSCQRRTTYVDLLCELGADPNLRSNMEPESERDYHDRMVSALDVACAYGHFDLVVKLVHTHGARVHTPVRNVWHEIESYGEPTKKICVDLLTPVQWIFENDMTRCGIKECIDDARIFERLRCFRFLVDRGAQLTYHDVLEYQKYQVAKHMRNLERLSVSEVEKRHTIMQFGGELLVVARHQETRRRAAVVRAILLLRSGRATVAENDARLARGASLLARVSLKGAFGQRFTRRVLDYTFDDGGCARALERRHRDAYEAAVGHELWMPSCKILDSFLGMGGMTLRKIYELCGLRPTPDASDSESDSDCY